MKTKYVRENQYLIVERDNLITGDRETVTYFCRGKYVWTLGGEQVCDGLASRGPTLIASPSTLLNVIRREMQVLMRNERRAVQS